MERLTKRSELHPQEVSTENLSKAMQKLADYEDAEEHGLLLRLPCKIGDIVYVLKKDEKIIRHEKVRDVQYRGETYKEGQRFFINIGALLYCEHDIGKTVFLTKEEAEAKLKEMENEDY